MDILIRIKRLVLARRIVITHKAQLEMEIDDLSEEDVIEAIINARRIDKVIRSDSPFPAHRGDRLYIIKGSTFSNVAVYTKGKIVKDAAAETFYILISSKKAV
jgi:hypothetical protein